MNTSRRPYRMRARAEAVAETQRRILAAMGELVTQRFLDEITLEEVAERAGVATRTVIRRFGGREGLVGATFAAGSAEIETRRGQVRVGDVEAAVEAVLEDYERYGDALIMMLAQERRHPELLGPLADKGREDHASWVEHVLAPRDRLHAAQLIAATDVYVWKLWRRDLGLSRGRTKKAMTEMVRRLV